MKIKMVRNGVIQMVYFPEDKTKILEQELRYVLTNVPEGENELTHAHKTILLYELYKIASGGKKL